MLFASGRHDGIAQSNQRVFKPDLNKLRWKSAALFVIYSGLIKQHDPLFRLLSVDHRVLFMGD
jgi:hypothetical protein